MNKPPTWFTAVAVVALIWNLLGVAAFVMDLRLTAADIAMLPPTQRALYDARPGWAVAATGLAVFGGTLGCIGLLRRQSWAVWAFGASLAGLVAQDFSLFVQPGAASTAGVDVLAMQATVFVVAVALVWLSRRAVGRGWLR